MISFSGSLKIFLLVDGCDMRKTMKSTAKKLEKDYGYLWDDVQRYVKNSPGTAVAISVGIGFLLGYLLRGGDDD